MKNVILRVIIEFCANITDTLLIIDLLYSRNQTSQHSEQENHFIFLKNSTTDGCPNFKSRYVLKNIFLFLN